MFNVHAEKSWDLYIKYDITTLTCQPYLKALSPQNLVASFRKIGIFPFNNKAILPDETAPSAIYIIDDSSSSNVPTETNTSQDANTENNLEDDHPQETTNTSENKTRIIDNEIQELTNNNETQEPKQ